MLLRGERPPLARRGSVALDGRDANAEGAGDLDGGHAPFFGFDDLLPQVQRVGVHGRILPHRPTTLQSALGSHPVSRWSPYLSAPRSLHGGRARHAPAWSRGRWCWSWLLLRLDEFLRLYS